jgi:argonaute-like protein implicated in RNA metabolism and viral defense
MSFYKVKTLYRPKQSVYHGNWFYLERIEDGYYIGYWPMIKDEVNKFIRESEYSIKEIDEEQCWEEVP